MSAATDRADAAAMLAEDGQTVMITRRAAGSYNPATGAATVTTSTQTAKAVIFPISRGLRKMGNTEIPATDVQCILSALTTAGAVLTAPQVDDTITDANSRVLTVVEVDPLAPAGTALFYDLTLRGNA